MQIDMKHGISGEDSGDHPPPSTERTINSLLLLLDLDGTLCPVGPGPDVAMRHRSIGPGSVSSRADLSDVLAELAARCKLAWARAWQDSANLVLAPALGLPALPVVRFTDPAADEVGSRHTGRTWKLPSVQRFAADRPLAWIDDELHGDAYAWATARRIPTKLLSTDPSRGIVDREIRSPLARRTRRGPPASQLSTSRREPSGATLNGGFPPAAAQIQSTLVFSVTSTRPRTIIDPSAARAPRLDRSAPSRGLGAAALHSSRSACSAT